MLFLYNLTCFSFSMARTKKQYSQAKGKKPINNGGKQYDISDDYDAFFLIYSEE